jgi:hypothetical protein
VARRSAAVANALSRPPRRPRGPHCCRGAAGTSRRSGPARAVGRPAAGAAVAAAQAPQQQQQHDDLGAAGRGGQPEASAPAYPYNSGEGEARQKATIEHVFGPLQGSDADGQASTSGRGDGDGGSGADRAQVGAEPVGARACRAAFREFLAAGIERRAVWPARGWSRAPTPAPRPLILPPRVPCRRPGRWGGR